MCGLLALLKSTVRSRATQKQTGTAPKPEEAETNSIGRIRARALRTTKDPQYMLEAILDGLEQDIQEETPSPRLRANIQQCRDFVAEHGLPEEDHYIWVKDGVVRVLTERERMGLRGSPRNVDNYLLCVLEWEVSHC